MNCFEKILVPLDFSINTEVAVKKAYALATPGISVIYLLHVLPAGLLGNVGAGNIISATADHSRQASNRLMEWKQKLAVAEPGLEVEVLLLSGSSVAAGLISVARDIKPSLIVIGKNNHHSFLPFLNTVISADLAEETGCPVLTVKPGSLNKQLETVVMPVADFYPRRKIDLLASLSCRLPLNVHLLTILNSRQHPDDLSASALLQAMRSIRSKLQCNVQHSIIHANNKAIATLRYAEQVGADMLLVNPETETSITSWMQRKDITDVLKPASPLQVLSVQAF